MTLTVGSTLRDDDGEEWMIRELRVDWVTLQHPVYGVHRLRRQDLEAWLEAERWTQLY